MSIKLGMNITQYFVAISRKLPTLLVVGGRALLMASLFLVSGVSDHIYDIPGALNINLLYKFN